jgi:hypothetical protein
MKSNSNTGIQKLACNALSVLALALFCCGCGSPSMALEKYKTNLAAAKNPIGIFTLRTQNFYKPAYTPEVASLEFIADNGHGNRTVAPARPFRQVDGQYLEYLISVELPPGSYKLNEIQGYAHGLLVQGHFKFPVKGHFYLTSGVSYLGHVDMVNRKRQANEPRSGGLLPLIDQAVCGFSGGTFDVAISDQSETELPAFISAYPQLATVTVATNVMQR